MAVEHLPHPLRLPALFGVVPGESVPGPRGLEQRAPPPAGASSGLPARTPAARPRWLPAAPRPWPAGAPPARSPPGDGTVGRHEAGGRGLAAEQVMQLALERRLHAQRVHLARLQRSVVGRLLPRRRRRLRHLQQPCNAMRVSAADRFELALGEATSPTTPCPGRRRRASGRWPAPGRRRAGPARRAGPEGAGKPQSPNGSSSAERHGRPAGVDPPAAACRSNSAQGSASSAAARGRSGTVRRRALRQQPVSRQAIAWPGPRMPRAPGGSSPARNLDAVDHGQHVEVQLLVLVPHAQVAARNVAFGIGQADGAVGVAPQDECGVAGLARRVTSNPGPEMWMSSASGANRRSRNSPAAPPPHRGRSPARSGPAPPDSTRCAAAPPARAGCRSTPRCRSWRRRSARTGRRAIRRRRGCANARVVDRQVRGHGPAQGERPPRGCRRRVCPAMVISRRGLPRRT